MTDAQSELADQIAREAIAENRIAEGRDKLDAMDLREQTKGATDAGTVQEG